MRIRTMTRLIVGIALIFGLAAPAAAQTPGNDPALFGVGVSFLNISDETGTGFTADIVKGIRTMERGSLGLVGDISYHSFDFVSAWNFAGGVRFTGMVNERIKPFGQFTIGIFRSSVKDCDGDGCSSTDLSFTPGGGVDFALNDRFNFRAQIDFMIIRFSDEGFSDTETGTRFMFGISMPVGGG